MKIKKLKILCSITVALIFFSSVIFAQNENNSANFKTGLVNGIEQLGLETGDLMLFQSKTFNGIATQIGTISPYTHCAIVIKNPDGSLSLLHSTDNDYHGNKISVLNEPLARNGVILTKVEDLFNSTDGGKTGFYEHIWIRKFDDKWNERPSREILLDLYEKHKNHPFTKSKMRFILSALDFKIFKKDILSIRDDDTYFCSEFIHLILKESGIPITDDQPINEYTPKNISQL